MKLLITGGCGFIGSNFVRHILDHAPESVVINYDKLTYAGNPANLASVQETYGKARYEFIHADIANPEAVNAAVIAHKPDAIINFAAESHVTRSIYDNKVFFETDVMGTQVIANSVLTHRDRIERFVKSL